jgi:hypothetical protein
MSNPIVNLNVRANTARAMADFKKFSDSLNNKFLVSGLKVDLITSTLKQINNEFQKSIGEQGLLGASSIRAAQNQAALLTSTFKGFGLEASKSINANMTKALSDVAVRAGGTMADIKKTMGAVPFISANLSSEDRTNLARQILSFQRDLRRSGVSEEGAAIGQKFLSGQTNVQDMMNSQDPITAKIGMTLANKGAQLGTIYNAQMRTEYLRELMNDPELNRFLSEQAKQTSGFKLYIEDLNTKLFNPESGLFGALRKVKMSATRTTTIFDETDRIINSVFGPKGVFIKFFKRIAETFKISDPLKFIIMGMDFLQKQLDALSAFIDSPKFQQILGFVKGIFDNTWNFFSGIYDQVTGADLSSNKTVNDIKGIGAYFGNIYNQVVGGSFDSAKVVADIKGIGTYIRQIIRNVGSMLRGVNIDKETNVGTSIVSTLVEETGKTVVTLIQEIFKVFIDKAPGIAAKALPAMSDAFNNIMTQMFGGLAGPIKVLMNFLPGPIGMLSRVANMTGNVGADSPWALAAIGSAAFLPNILRRVGGADRLRRGWQNNIGRRLRTRGDRGGRGNDDTPGGGDNSGPRITQTLRETLDNGDEGDVMQYGSVIERPAPPAPPAPPTPRQGRVRRGINRAGGFVGRNLGKFAAASLVASAVLLWANKGRSTTIDEMAQYGGEGGQPKPVSLSERMGISRVNMKNMAAGSAGVGNFIGGAANGAMLGAAFGPWGALIGGVLGAGSSLLDKGTRDGIGKFVRGFGGMVGDWIGGIGNAFNRSVSNIWNGITKVLTGFVDLLKKGFESLPIVQMFKGIAKAASGATGGGEKKDGNQWWDLLDKVPNYNGLNNSGSALAMEARMSGNRSFLTGGGNIANNGEIIIPSGSIGTLAYILEAKMANRSGSGGGTPTIFKLDININNPVMLGDNEELIASLRDPVLDIVNDAYKSVANNRIRSTVIS